MDIHDLKENVKTKKDFEDFLEALLMDLELNEQNWENTSLKDFLEALHAYSIDLEGYYKNNKIEFDENQPNWKTFAQILVGAKVYE